MKRPTDDGKHLTVHGGDESYYTGKLEAYLRAKGIEYRLEPFSRPNLRRCAEATGVVQVPQVECANGDWLVDTTLIIEHFEREKPEPALSPAAPAAKFVSRLLEDYADEWLWRPAMHYRWSYRDSSRLMRGWLAEHFPEIPLPMAFKRQFWFWRQWGFFVRGDGVDKTTRTATEAAYLGTLKKLEAIFKTRPYILGARPTEADFGFFASMFRHFCCDPTPGRIMRASAPAVHEWVARLWNASPERYTDTERPRELPSDLDPLLADVVAIYLPYLDANASAFARGDKKVLYQVQNASWREPVKPYRVWCRDRLHREFAALSDSSRAEIETLLPQRHALDSLLAPSPKQAADVVGSLPVRPGAPRRARDSWWR